MSDVESKLLEFVKERFEDELVECDIDTDLFANGLLDSMGAIAMIALIEEITGREIDVEHLKPEQLKTVRQIIAQFFSAPTSVTPDND